MSDALASLKVVALSGLIRDLVRAAQSEADLLRAYAHAEVLFDGLCARRQQAAARAADAIRGVGAARDLFLLTLSSDEITTSFDDPEDSAPPAPTAGPGATGTISFHSDPKPHNP